VLQIETTYKAEIINTAEYLNTKYKEDQFVNIVRSHEISEPNMNSTNKTAAKLVEKLNQRNEDSNIRKEGIQHTKAILGGS
jgi:bisphosphoglycerate-dependent phosphoglycerate mutase